MGTVADKLNKVQDTKDGLKAKLIAKGQPVSDSDTFASYIDKLGAIPTPVDGSIPTNGASNLSASGKTVTVPAGYYPSQVTKDVDTATQATPEISVDSAGKITASATQTAGYVSAGTMSATKQLTTQAEKTVTPTKSEQTAVASGVYTTGEVKVAAIPDAYQDVTGVTAGAADVLAGKKFVDADGNIITGTMVNRGAVSQALAAGGSYTIPAGYHNGSGKVTAEAAKATKTVTFANISAKAVYMAADGTATTCPASGTTTLEVLHGIFYSASGTITVTGGEYIVQRIFSSSYYLYILLDDGCTVT